MALALSDQLQEMRLGDHLCLIYETPEERMAAIVPFFLHGFERGEACVYIADDHSVEEVKHALTRNGIEVHAQIAGGALRFATQRESYLPNGRFDPDSMIEFLRGSMNAALAAGFSGYRVTGEMSWALGPEPGCERLIEYEAKLNEFFPGSRSMAICQYNRRLFPAEIIRDVLRTHPLAVIGERVCPNLYYEDPKMILEECSTENRVDWMIRQLTRFHASEYKLKESIRARDEFLSVASHELKTPLTSLSIQVQLLGREAKRHPEQFPVLPPLGDRIEQAVRQTKRLASLVDTLMDVSRVNRGRVDLELAPVDVSSVVHEAVERATEEAKEKGVVIHLDHVDSVRARVDRLRLEQVLTNFLSNAVKYGDGKPVSVELRATGRAFVVSVRDQGIGIKSEDLDRIFTRFERAVSAKNFPGLGLGLFVAHEIAKAHGGKISVESEPGKGSCFALEIPLEPTQGMVALH